MKKSILIPGILTVYLAVMAGIGYKQWAKGAYSSGYYFGLIALTLVCIILLYFNLRRRENNRKNNR